jgi:SlyX protein
MEAARINRAEERVAWLERHVLEQDRAMLEISEQVEALKREVMRLRDRAASLGTGDAPQAPDERPPHY